MYNGFVNRKAMESVPVSIRIATYIDIPSILKIEEQSWLFTYPNQKKGITVEDVTARFIDKSASEEFLRESLEDPQNQVYILEKNKDPVGYIHLLREADYNDIVQIYLLPGQIGQGYGSEAMRYILDLLGDKKPIRLQVATYNTAIHFYEKFGFEKTKLPQPEGEDWNVLPSGKVIPVLVMERPAKS